MLPANTIISLESKTGNDEQGQPTYGPAVNHKADFQRKTTFQRKTAFQGTDDSTVIIADGILFIDVSIVIVEGDRVTVGSYAGTVITVEPQEDFAGVSYHNEVYLHSK